jgi:hypothetical protein
MLGSSRLEASDDARPHRNTPSAGQSFLARQRVTFVFLLLFLFF